LLLFIALFVRQHAPATCQQFIQRVSSPRSRRSLFAIVSRSEIDDWRSGRREIFTLDADVLETECAAIRAYPMPRGIIEDFRFLWRAANSNDFSRSRPYVRHLRAISAIPSRSRIEDSNKKSSTYLAGNLRRNLKRVFFSR